MLYLLVTGIWYWDLVTRRKMVKLLNSGGSTCSTATPVHTLTYGSFKDTVVDVVGATLRAGESEPLAVFVALLVGQLDRSSQHAVSLLLSLVLLLGSELARVQTWDGQQLSIHRVSHLF